MNRNRASTLAIGSLVAVAAVGFAVTPGKARGDDITLENTPFIGARTRAEVQADLKTPYPDVLPLRRTLASDEVVREYKMSRDEVKALTGEDSGSAYFKRMPARNASAVMGAPPEDFYIVP